MTRRSTFHLFELVAVRVRCQDNTNCSSIGQPLHKPVMRAIASSLTHFAIDIYIKILLSFRDLQSKETGRA